MDRTERFYKINQLLENHRQVSFAQMKDALEVSRATLRTDSVVRTASLPTASPTASSPACGFGVGEYRIG